MRMKVSLGIMPDYAHQGKCYNKRPARIQMKDGMLYARYNHIYKYMEILSKLAWNCLF